MSPRRPRGSALELRAATTAARPQPASGYVALDALGRLLDGAGWAPLQLATPGRRPVSPRLAHAVALHVAHELRRARPAAVDTSPTQPGVVPELVRLGALTAAPGEVVASVVEALLGAGVLAPAGSGRGAVALAAHVRGPAPRVGELAWDAIADATIGSPSAWVLAHHLAELLDRDGWTPVSRRALEQALGCGTSGLRAALDRLVAADVLARREQPGGVSGFRFTERVTRGAGREAVAAAALRRRPDAPSRAEPRLDDEGVVLQVGGVDLDVPPGMRVVITRGADGRPRVAVTPDAGS